MKWWWEIIHRWKWNVAHTAKYSVSVYTVSESSSYQWSTNESFTTLSTLKTSTANLFIYRTLLFTYRTPLSLDSSNNFDCVPNTEAWHNTQWNSAVCTPEPGLFSAFHGLLPQVTSFSLLCIAHLAVSVGLVLLWCRWDLIWEMAASQAEFVTHSNAQWEFRPPLAAAPAFPSRNLPSTSFFSGSPFCAGSGWSAPESSPLWGGGRMVSSTIWHSCGAWESMILVGPNGQPQLSLKCIWRRLWVSASAHTGLVWAVAQGGGGWTTCKHLFCPTIGILPSPFLL